MNCGCCITPSKHLSYYLIKPLNPTLCGGGLSALPKVLVSGAFQSDLRDPKCWHNSYMILDDENWFYDKKFKFFSFLDFQNHCDKSLTMLS